MKLFWALILLMCGFVTAVWAQEEFETLFLDVAKSAQVQKFDPALPPISMLHWINSVAMPYSKVVWEVNDCGEQTGSPADEGRDFPACVEATFLVTPETQAHVSIIVGTFKRGVVGQPDLFQLFLERQGQYRDIGKLSEISSIAK